MVWLAWLTTVESEVPPVIKEKMVAANSSQTTRSRSRTGKHSRQLVSPWTETPGIRTSSRSFTNASTADGS